MVAIAREVAAENVVINEMVRRKEREERYGKVVDPTGVYSVKMTGNESGWVMTPRFPEVFDFVAAQVGKGKSDVDIIKEAAEKFPGMSKEQMQAICDAKRETR